MKPADRFRSQFRVDPPKGGKLAPSFISETPQEQQHRRHVSQFGSWPEGASEPEKSGDPAPASGDPAHSKKGKAKK